MISKQSNKAKTALATNTKEALQNPKGCPVGHKLQWRRLLASYTLAIWQTLHRKRASSVLLLSLINN